MKLRMYYCAHCLDFESEDVFPETPHCPACGSDDVGVLTSTDELEEK